MKVLQVNADWGQGGPGTIGKDLCDALEAHGHHCIVTYGRESEVHGVTSYRLDLKNEVVMHALLSRLFGNEGSYSKSATRKLIDIIKNHKPDIVQLHNLLGHYINHAMLFNFLKEEQIPTFWTIHDCSPFTGHCINFERVNCDKWKSQCRRCPLYRDYPYSFFLDTSSRVFKQRKKLYGDMQNLHIIVPSEWMKNRVQESFLHEREIYMLHNGINLDEFKPTDSDILKQHGIGDKIVLVAAAYNWNEMKGWNILCDLADRLDQKYALVVIGNKDEKAVHGNMISIPVITDTKELVKWYSAANIFLNPTLGDNFPTVNIEALACGAPIVTTDTGGSPEIAGNEYGRIVYSKTVDEFLRKIDDCFNAGYSKEECHNFAMRFDRKNCYKKYIEVYESVLNRDWQRGNR